MLKRHLPPFIACIATISSLIGMHTASGAGFQIQEQSVKGLGNAFAGGAAVAEDASTTLYNPAGLVRLNERQAEFAGHIIIPQSEFNDEGSTSPIGAPSIGKDDDGGSTAFVPNFSIPIKSTTG